MPLKQKLRGISKSGVKQPPSIMTLKTILSKEKIEGKEKEKIAGS